MSHDPRQDEIDEGALPEGFLEGTGPTDERSRKVLDELLGVETDVQWPARGSSDPRVTATVTHPDRPFEVELVFLPGEPTADREDGRPWACVSYRVGVRGKPGRRSETTLAEVTPEVARHYAEWFPAYRDFVADGLNFAPRSLVDEAKALLRMGPRGLPERFYQAIASEYRRHLAAGDPPTVTIGKEFEVGRSTAAYWIAGARKRGYLGPARNSASGEAGAASPRTTVQEGTDS